MKMIVSQLATNTPISNIMAPFRVELVLYSLLRMHHCGHWADQVQGNIWRSHSMNDASNWVQRLTDIHTVGPIPIFLLPSQWYIM